MAWVEEDGVDETVIRERLYEASNDFMSQKAAQFGPENMRMIEKQLLLQAIDSKWREHLLTLEHLRSVVGFRGYAQRDPLSEYKTEGFQLFESMLDSLREEVSQKLGQIRPLSQEEQDAMVRRIEAQRVNLSNAAQATPPQGEAEAEAAAPGFVEADPSTWGNPARNDACPCGSGKKFKHCHGVLT